MMFIAGLIGGLGLISMISKRTILGLLIGIQLLILGSTMMFVTIGAASDQPMQGYIFGIFITLGGMAQLAVGYALAVRLFFLKKRISLQELRTLKR